jgi:hypothetical protein
VGLSRRRGVSLGGQKAEPLAAPAQPIQILLAIPIIPEDQLAFVASRDDVIDGPFRLQPQRTWHRANNTRSTRLTPSSLILELHDRPADKVNPDAIARQAFATDLDVDLDPDVHLPAAFGHLGKTEYSSTEYTFLWSQVIAKDLWSAFDPANPLAPQTARRYRDTILRPGKSRPAAESVREFLGRPFDLASWRRWLERG